VTTGPTPGYSASAGLPFDDQELESKLAWIWGSPRSGSTWLLEMLCHPLVMDPESDLGFGWRADWDGAVWSVPVDEFQIGAHLAPGVFGDLAGNGLVEDEDGEILPRTVNRTIDSYSSYAFSTAYANVWRPEARRLTLVRLHAVVERARAAGLNHAVNPPLVVIKEVNGSHAADVVMSLFPRSRMIFMLRDGRDILDSLLDATSPSGWIRRAGLGKRVVESPEERLEFVRETAAHWTARMNACASAFAAHPHDLRIEVRYEELLADTPGVLGDLAAWLDLPGGPKRIQNIAKSHSFEAIPDKRKGPGKSRRSATPGAWREGLTTEEQAVAEEIMGETLSRLGYD
jgi:sulfotransferase family protein